MSRPEVPVIGSGVMGRGIAKSFAAAGISSVTGVEPRVAMIGTLPHPIGDRLRSSP